MNTEKNIMRKFFSLFKKSKNSKIEEITDNDTEFKLGNKKYENLFRQHKNFVRTWLNFNPGNINTFLSILPFIMGLSQFLNQKYSSQKNNLFFEQNLPGLSLPTQKINWDTFQYLHKNNQIDFSQLVTNQITWDENNLIITSYTNDLVFPNSEKNLITYLSKPKQQNKSLVLKNLKFNLKEQNLSVVDIVYQNLDELPTKLESSNGGNFDHKKFKFISSIYSDSVTTQNLIKSNLTKKILSKPLIEGDFLIGYNLMDNTKKSFFVNQKKGVYKKLKTNSLSINKENFFSSKVIFNRELKKLFLETNFFPPNLESKIGQQFRYLNSNLLKNQEQQILHKIDQIYASKPMQLTRLMSGYTYPDMKKVEVISYIFQSQKNLFKNWKLILSPSYLGTQISSFNHLPKPNYLIQSKKLILKDNSGREIFYDGPSILLNKDTGFDWKTSSPNSSSLRKWLENYFGATNAAKLSTKNFFGIFDSPEISESLTGPKTGSGNYYLENLPIYQKGLISNTSVSFIPFNRSFALPTISTTEWETRILNYLNNNELNASHTNTILLPILEIRNLTFSNPKLLFGYKNSIDFEFVQPLNLKKILNNQINFNLNTSNLPNTNLFSINLAPGKYQKIPSLFNGNDKGFFTDLWEPLTFNSWLITAQVGFAFLVFQVLKALADNYGRELLVYLLDLVALLGFLDDDLKQEIEILMGQKEKGFRIIQKTTKNFNNIGGIQKLLPEIIEIVWFLRNSGREFSLSKTLPRGVLLTGPPGTGKTLLVQAIAGEAEVPVLALSGSSLLEPGESGALKLEILFQEARKIAPCIVFIDEMDTLAQKRSQVLQNPMGADEILESLSIQLPVQNLTNFNALTSENSDELTDAIFAQQDMQKEKLRILMQFLIELDGIQGRDGVVVIGATNRPEMLDTAILRPGRFDRVLDLGLPGPEKRYEILKLYSENLGIDKTISWNYLIQRTAGYSAADLAGIMNQSTLHAILQNTCHTVETIEYGIDRITTIGSEKPENTSNKKLLSSQVAYYQAGKILLSALLEYHPSTLVSHLWPRRTNVRALQITENLQKYFFRFGRRIELEHRIIGCYGGKAAEILFLQDINYTTNLSDLGTEDIQFAQNLIHYMIENWHFYGKNILIQQNASILDNFNQKEYQDVEEKLPFFDSTLDKIELSLINKGEQFGNNFYDSSSLLENIIERDSQKYFPTASWQYQIANEFELSTRTFSDWYRLYLPDPQQTERNLEWTPPDEFYHRNRFTEKLTESITWNELPEIQIDYEIHSIILESFNKSILLVHQYREILDQLAYELLHKEILREPEIKNIFQQFSSKSASLSTSIFSKNHDIENLRIEFSQNNLSRISQNWGPNSREQQLNWIDFKKINKY
jgi:ATP-dependent Zn protease